MTYGALQPQTWLTRSELNGKHRLTRAVSCPTPLAPCPVGSEDASEQKELVGKYQLLTTSTTTPHAPLGRQEARAAQVRAPQTPPPKCPRKQNGCVIFLETARMVNAWLPTPTMCMLSRRRCLHLFERRCRTIYDLSPVRARYDGHTTINERPSSEYIIYLW
jgi:hypothetical protein